jgi:hypothetical protein
MLKLFQVRKVFFFLFFFGAGMEPKASRMLGKRCTTKLHPSPISFETFFCAIQNNLNFSVFRMTLPSLIHFFFNFSHPNCSALAIYRTCG